MCFRDPYDSLDASTLRQLNNILLEEARNKEGIRKAKENAKEMKRQDKEQKRIAKVKSRLEKKYGPRMQPEPDSRKKYESSSSSSEEPEYRQHRRHYRRSRDSQRVSQPTGMDREGAPAHITHTEFGEFHSAPLPPPPLETQVVGHKDLGGRSKVKAGFSRAKETSTLVVQDSQYCFTPTGQLGDDTRV